MIHDTSFLNGKIIQDFEVWNLFSCLWKVYVCFTLFNYFFIQYTLFSTYYVPGTALNIEDAKQNKTKTKNPVPSLIFKDSQSIVLERVLFQQQMEGCLLTWPL